MLGHLDTDGTGSTHNLVLLFDGTCGICTRVARWVRERDVNGTILAIPSQTSGVADRFSVTAEDAGRRVYAIDSNGRKFAGAAAVNRTLEELGGIESFIGKLYRIPPLTVIENVLYVFVARYRHLLSHWGDRPACDDPSARCDDARV